jgi:hypothetical protein
MIRKSFFALLVLVLAFSFAAAQAPIGKIIGKVVDDQGSPLPGVSVTAASSRLVGNATALTNETGTYRLLALPPGTYTIVYTLPGFSSVTRTDIVLSVEQTLTVDAVMTPGKIEEQITVVGRSPMIDVKNTTRGATLTRQMFTTLPKGRNFDSLLVTVPGVNVEYLLAGTSVDGASGAENMYYVDGISTSSIINGTSSQSVNYDFVEEVSFKSSGYNAEFGGSLGGVVNVLTRSGGNAYRGEILAYYVDEALTGQRRDLLNLNYKSTSNSFAYYSYADYVGKDKLHNIEGGFNLGGYLIKDGLWFFISAMPQYQSLDRTMNFALQSNPTFTRTISENDTWWNGQAKLSAQPFNGLRLSASVVNNLRTQRGSMANAWNASTTTDYGSIGFNYPDFSASGTADLILSSNLMVGLRGGFFRTNQDHQMAPVASGPDYIFQMEQPYSYDSTTNDIAKWPEIPASLRHGSGWTDFPVGMLNNQVSTIREKYMAALDLTYYFNAGGEHAIKIGGQFIRQGENVDSSAQQPLVYLAWDQELVAYGTDYGRGTYGWYAVRGNAKTGPYGNSYDAFSNQWAFYVQDSWTIGNRLTLNLGLRDESEYVPNYSTDPAYASITKPINFPFSKKLSPRLGFIYDMFGDSSLKIYGSFAIYEDVMKLDMAANALGGFKWKSAYYTLDDYDFTKIGVNGSYPGTYLTMFDFRPVAFDLVDPNMKPFTQREIAFGVEKMLAENLSLSFRVVNKSVLYAIEDQAYVDPNQGEVYYYTNPGSAFMENVYQYAKSMGYMDPGVPHEPNAKRVYWGVNFGIEKRLADNWLLGFNYTWSRLTGNYSGLANSDEAGRNNPNGERSFDLWQFSFDSKLNPIDGPLPTDRPHYFKLYGSYVFKNGLTVGLVLNAMSGTPLSTAWNVDGPGYYPYGRADLGRTPFLFYGDFYAQYDLKFGRYGVQFNINISNVFNTDTWTNEYCQYNRGNYSPGDAVLLSKNVSIPSTIALDPRFGQPNAFFAPLQARLGMKFNF